MKDVEITIACRPGDAGWVCDVSIAEPGSQTTHVVSVSDEELRRYSSSTDVEQLVERSFRFLLERESKESILRRFALSDIERYFPEFRRQINPP